jgi:hypothetical protein
MDGWMNACMDGSMHGWMVISCGSYVYGYRDAVYIAMHLRVVFQAGITRDGARIVMSTNGFWAALGRAAEADRTPKQMVKEIVAALEAVCGSASICMNVCMDRVYR